MAASYLSDRVFSCADAGIGARYMAREDATVLGMLGSGGMAQSHLEALLEVRKIQRVQVYSRSHPRD